MFSDKSLFYELNYQLRKPTCHKREDKDLRIDCEVSCEGAHRL